MSLLSAPRSVLSTDDSRRERCLRGARALLRAAAQAEGPRFEDATIDEVTTVVAIVSSSRGGSSLLYHLLADRDDTLSIAGEHTATYKLNRLDRHHDGSDALPADTGIDRAGLSRDLLDGLGIGLRHRPEEIAGYAVQIARRLAVQWPLENVELAHIRTAVAESLAEIGPHGDPGLLFALVLRRLHGLYPGVDLDYYDLPEHRRPGSPRVSPPNPLYCIEEPPFVVPYARRRPVPADLRRLPLVIKSSVDAYRLPLLRRIFPKADLRVIHLTRNAAASTNGLMDGWRDRGFFSYDVSSRSTLDIAGYSELSPDARHWWNFDIFPGWTSYTSASLPEVCVRQWHSAHQAILADLDATVADAALRVRFEDLVDPATRTVTLQRIHRFAGLSDTAAPADLPVVMATARPSTGRWRARKNSILAAAMQDDVLDLTMALGYRRDPSTWR